MGPIIIYIAIGIFSGIIMGFFGLAGGVITIPALMYLAGFSQKTASGTNLLVLIVPVSFAAAMNYYRSGNADIKAAAVIAGALCISAWISSRIALKINGDWLRVVFGLFVITMGLFISIPAISKLLKQ
jgi:uncharacterized protein